MKSKKTDNTYALSAVGYAESDTPEIKFNRTDDWVEWGESRGIRNPPDLAMPRCSRRHYGR